MKKSYTNLFIKRHLVAVPNPWDIFSLVIILSILFFAAWGARQMAVPYEVGEVLPVTLDPHALPYYGLRTVSRMFIALFFSLLATFIFGAWAAKSKRAESIIIPAIDVLQAIPYARFDTCLRSCSRLVNKRSQR